MRKAEVLLAYLALTPGLRHPRERLINLLWSDRSEEQARNSLRQCLSAIRKSLGDVADMVLLVDRTTVCLIPELIDIDVHEFEHLAGEGDYESLITAADLYQGEFLEGISIRDASCQEWLDSELKYCRSWPKPNCSATISVTQSNPPSALSNRTRSANQAGAY
jgi:DNA-binding SARP family transcriptional activator